MPRRHAPSRTGRFGFQARQHFRPRLEALEQRMLLACEVFTDASRTLIVQGDEGDNRIAIVGGREQLRVTCDGVTTRVELANIDAVQVLAGGGNDTVIRDESAPIPIRIKGQDGDDTVHVRDNTLDVDNEGQVTPDDAIIGGGGNDTVVISAAHAAAIVKIFGVVRDVPDPEFQIYSRATGNLLAHLFVQEAEAIRLNTGDGDDQVEMHDRQGLLAGIDWSIQTGGGDDEFNALMGVDPRAIAPS